MVRFVRPVLGSRPLTKAEYASVMRELVTNRTITGYVFVNGKEVRRRPRECGPFDRLAYQFEQIWAAIQELTFEPLTEAMTNLGKALEQ
jgi:hypothetical protein